MGKDKSNLTIEQRLLNYHTRLQGVSTDLAIKLLAVMSLTDADVKDLLISELPKQKDTLKAELKRLPKIIEKITAIRKKSYDAGKDLIFDTVAKVVSKCTDVTAQAVNAEIEKARRNARERRFCKTLTPEQQQAIIQGQGVDGATIAKWFEKFQLADLERIASFCQRASVEAMSVADITRAVRGTKANNYTDGLLATTQSSAVMLARTLINGVSNNTRAETIKANSDVIDGIKFLATLDGKTCKLCAPYDGYIWRGDDMSQARRPPIHPNCRCTLIPYVELKDQDGNPIDLEGERPAAREDFEDIAKKAYNQRAKDNNWQRRWDDLSPSSRLKYYYRAMKDYEARTGQSAYAQVDGSTTFAEYFKTQPESFQRSWLGATRYASYKTGALSEESIFKPQLGYRVLINDFVKSTEDEDELQALVEQAQAITFKVDADGFPTDADGLEQLAVVRSLGGSTGAQLVQAPDGTRYVLKRGNNEGHLRSECYADAFYRASGADVPPFRLYETPNGPVKLSHFFDETKSLKDWWNTATDAERKAMRAKLREHFAVDVLTGNWDVVGMSADNILIDKDGRPWRIDNGGALSYRAQGAPKADDAWSDGFVDDLWTMTGNGARIGNNVRSNLPNYFGDYDVLSIATEINAREWQSALEKLTDDQRQIVEKRLEEVRQLAERGNRYVKIEDPVTFPRETALQVLDITYQMSKEGLREVLANQTTPPDNSFTPRRAGWFHYDGNSPQTVGGKQYRTFGYYLADKIGADGYNFIQKANADQGGDSYRGDAMERKYCVLKNMGFDCLDTIKYPTPNDFFKAIEQAGYYCGIGNAPAGSKPWKHRQGFVKSFNRIRTKKKDRLQFEKNAKAVLVHNAVMQLLLENTKIFGSDPKTGTLILARTENESIFRNKIVSGQRADFNCGVCESHSHMNEVVVYGDRLTLVRVPYSRVHGVWFIQRYQSPNGSLYSVPKSDTQFFGAAENEFNTDDHGLPVIFDGKGEKYRRITDMTWQYLTDWESQKKNTKDTVLWRLQNGR